MKFVIYEMASRLQAPVVQRQDNVFRWMRHYSGYKIYFTLNVVQGIRTLPNLAVDKVIRPLNNWGQLYNFTNVSYASSKHKREKTL